MPADVRNTSRLLRKLSQLPSSLQKPINNALEASAAEMHGLAVQRIQKNSGGGRTYRRGKRMHVASAPGQYPNTDTGQLVGSMFWELRRALVAVWGARKVYAKHLEFGTSRMAARPFMRPTFKALEKKARARVRAAVQAALRASSRG